MFSRKWRTFLKSKTRSRYIVQLEPYQSRHGLLRFGVNKVCLGPLILFLRCIGSETYALHRFFHETFFVTTILMTTLHLRRPGTSLSLHSDTIFV